jgi:hypothetical protein
MAKKAKSPADTKKKTSNTESAMKKSKYSAPPKFGGLD